ncbi:TldD/PmbA family protein [Labilibacter marinus]|uniref:TldD/PmbA family protein n=1 Tax=Labilibacter marinus TaxID=1477105 RepID=UPI00094FB06D|nr:TldD/PmbA family protein [Labilibacter marinus]
MGINKVLVLLMVTLLSSTIIKAQDKLIDILDKELQREMIGLKGEKYPPYYMAYRLNEIETASIVSSFGSTLQLDTAKIRICLPTVRVGSYENDNTHSANEGMGFGGRGMGQNFLPVENNPQAISQYLWRMTDQAYRGAVREYSNSKFEEKEEKDTIPDFTREKPVTFIQEESNIKELNTQEWEERLNKITEIFNANNDIVDASAMIRYNKERKYFVSTEGSKVKQLNTYCYLHINGVVKATDGMICPLNLSYFGFTPNDLPNEEKLMSDVAGLIEKLNRLKEAPLAEPYEGPAILSSKAAGVFFHEIFGHRAEGHRIRQKTDGQTFKDKMGEYVLPKGFNVTFDPTINTSEGYLLSGHYLYDDEGVKSEKVEIVKNGIFQSFLMSRCPTDRNSVSNGHGRAQAGSAPVTRQSNMLVSVDKTYSIDKLRKQMIKECKKQNKEYGYLFQEVSGGFTQTDRIMPNAFNVTPLEVYRIYVDGRPDELVRGVSMIGTPLAMFAQIQSAGADQGVFNGHCGAESGSVPVATLSPSLFIKQIETQKQMYIESSETILDRPRMKSSSESK